MQYEDDRKEKRRRDEMERQAREARAARLAEAASTSRNQQQHNQDSSDIDPDDNAPMSILPVHEGELAEDSAEQLLSAETTISADDNAPTSTSKADKSPQVSVRFV